MFRTTDRSKALGALSVAALIVVAAACSSDNNKAAPTTSAAGATVSTVSSSATSGSGTTSATLSPGERAPKDPPNPAHGGKLVYGLEADSAGAWAPYKVSCATSCLAVMRGITDSLFGVDPDGKMVPYLVKSFDHNADYTQWTMHLRDGIKFQDGTAFDGAAVKFNVDACRTSPLTGTAFAPIGKIDASGQDVVFTLQGGPWTALPAYFGYAQCGFMFSPKWLGSLADVPQRSPQSPVYDAALAATPADGDPQKPVGLGAFMYKSYTPGNGNAFVAVRNPDYWRGPNGITGEQLPYLDEIDYVVAIDEESRSNSLKSGDFHVMMTSMGDTIKSFLDDSKFEVNSSTKFGETGYFLLNLAAGPMDPTGKNAKSPLLNLDCRKALAGAIDVDRANKERNAGLGAPTNGMFQPGSIGYVNDTGYPKFDVAAAQAEMDKCLAALGTDHIEFAFDTTNDPFNVESNSLIASMWQDAFGNKVQAKITPIEQGQYIGLLLTGAFNASGARGFGIADPDQIRWSLVSTSAAPIGSLALNVGRLTDPVIDQAFNTIKTSSDPAARKAAAETINKQYSSQVDVFWLWTVLWGIISQPYVHGVQANKLPDGSQGIGLAFTGLHNINQMWCDNGKCS
jgi:peptide/nickel transport system substrate-binding protein